MKLVAALVVALFGCARPSPSGPLPDDAFGAAVAYLDSAVAGGAAPGAVLGVSHGGRHFYHATGRLGTDDATSPDSATIYDLASLTKVVGLTTAVMLALEEKRIELHAPVQRYVPAFSGGLKSKVTLRHLLTHSSGLPAWRPLHKETSDRAAALLLADTTALDTAPGTRFVYSDVGAIVLTQAVETAYGERLDSILARRVFAPLGLSSTMFLPPPELAPRIAPTELDPWRGWILRGEVHDENAARLEGVSGHAGLFSTARDLLHFGDWILAVAQGRRDTLTDGKHPKAFFRKQNQPRGSSRALGWDTPSEGSSAGTRLSRHSFGHTGFTGTSIWVDPRRDLVIVLLSNRVHPTRDNSRWGPVRREVADRIAAAAGRL